MSKKKPEGEPHGNIKITPDVEARIVSILRNAGSRKDAAIFCGIDRSTIQRACKRDPEFAARLEKAEIDCKMLLLQKVLKDKSFQATKFLLACKWPEEYAERQIIKHQGDITAPMVSVDFSKMTPEEIDAFIAKLDDHDKRRAEAGSEDSEGSQDAS